MRASAPEMPELELALLRRGVHERSSECERCDACRRTPLVGETVHLYESGAVLCELCRALSGRAPAASRLIHGPEFGHTIRLTDRRWR